MASHSSRNWLYLGSLARYVDRSPRTLRQYCKIGLIPEAFRTAGGRYRIHLPLSRKTKRFLRTIKAGCASDPNNTDSIGDFESEWAETLTEAHLRGKRVEDLYDEADQSESSPTQINALDRIQKDGRAAEMHKALRTMGEQAREKLPDQRKLDQIERDGLAARRRIWDTQLHGLVKQYVLRYQYRPTVAEIAQTMRIGRSEFYRRGLSSKKLKHAYRIARDEFISDLPDQIADESIRRAKVKAKKPNFSQLQRDFRGNDLNFAQRSRQPTQRRSWRTR